MNDVGMTIRPLFANALHCGSEESEIGLYNFILDALVIPVESWGVRKHEVTHRVFAHDGTSGSDFLAVRRLIGISHALCMQVFKLADEHDLFIHGKRLGELRVSGQNPVRTTVENLLSRVEEYERVIDIVWRSLVPVAEIAAIDFSENLDPRDPSWYIWRSTSLSAKERERLDEQKARLVQAAVAGYPPDFGGYHLTHGSFQEAVRHAWAAYNRIEDDGARKELLRLAMSSLSPIDNEAKFHITDPIKLILDNASFGQQHAEEARQAFFVERLNRSQAVFAWVDLIAARVFKDIDDKSLLEDSIQEAWVTVDLIQEVWKKIQDEAVRPGVPILTLGMYDVSDRGDGPWFSFLRFVWNANGGGVASINPVFLDMLGQMVPSNPSFPINYLFRLLFREQLRWALKTGQPIVCPFKGYKISSTHRKESLKCNVSCLMRTLLESVSQWSELNSDDALCEIPTKAPEESGVPGPRRQVDSPKVVDTVIKAHKETPQMTEGKPPCCSFCGKSHEKVRKLIAGPQDLHLQRVYRALREYP